MPGWLDRHSACERPGSRLKEVIDGNGALTSLAGLEGITAIHNTLVIRDNNALRECTCGLSGLISEGAFTGVAGNIGIYNNAPDAVGGTCNSPEQVLANPCQTNTDVERPDTELPADYALAQNYPNPFNPTTEIAFALPRPSAVHLVVYDVTGRTVAVLVDRPMAAGHHAVRFEGRDLPSGVYLYRLSAGPYTEARTMVLTK